MVRTRRRRISLRIAARCSVTNSSMNASAITSSGTRMERIDRRAAEAEHRRRLVQRVPPVDRELDDRHVDRADQRQDRRRARAPRPGSSTVAPQRDHAEIHQEQHQHRGQPRVPHPIGAPHRPAPQRAGDEAEQGEGRADRRRRLARRRRRADGATPECRARRCSSVPSTPIASQAAGTWRNMIFTTGALLVVVGRVDRRCAMPAAKASAVAAASHGKACGKREEARRVGEVDQRHSHSSPLRMAAAAANGPIPRSPVSARKEW